MRKIKKLICLILAIALIANLAGCDFDQLSSGPLGEFLETVGIGSKDETKKKDDPTNNDALIENEKLSITMLDVGQGLSILLESNGEYMLYDGGDRDASSYVVAYLDQHNINHLKYMFASHYDDDHINGLVGVLNTTKVDTVVNPNYETDTKVYNSYQQKLSENGADVDYPKVGDKYKLGYASITVLAPARNYDDYNEMSVAIKVQCDDFVCIITGDAEKESEADMLKNGINLDADLYIVGHHGSSSSSTEEFVEAMSPEYAFISCGKDNSYGHPTDKTLTTLAKYGVNVYRTDHDGEVTCSTDGKNYTFNKNTSYKDTIFETEEYNGEYVLNTSSMKFHLPNCSAVANMNEKNKAVSAKSRNELIDDGYSACGYCDP